MRASFQTLLTSLIGLALLLAIGFGCSSDSPIMSDVAIDNNQLEVHAKPVTTGRGLNLIPNPGFESGFWDWEYSPDDGWSISTENPHSGQKCASYTVPGGTGWAIGYLFTAQDACILIDGNSPRYRLSYWARTERPDGAPADSIPAVVMARFHLNNQIYFTPPMQLTESWQRSSTALTITGSGCGFLWVILFGDATSSTVVIALDDFELRSY